MLIRGQGSPRRFFGPTWAPIAGCAVGSLLVGSLVSRDLRLAIAISGALLIASVLATARGRAETQLLVGIVVLSATTDLPQLIRVGPVSGLGALTILIALMTVPFWLLNPGAVKLVPLPVCIFLVWVLAIFCVNWLPPTIGVQNVLVFALFAGMVGIARYLTIADGAAFLANVERAFWIAGWLAVFLYAASVAAGGLGSGRVVGSRSFALFALVVFGWALARFRFDRQTGTLPLMLFVMIVLSLSRGALAAATVMIALAWLDLRTVGSWLKAASGAALAAAAFLIAVGHVQALHSRFYTGDVQNVAPGLSINTTGRESIWRPVWNDYLTSPWIGHGPGSGDNLTARLSGFATDSTVGSGNVHNDYLRLLHDFGAIGLAAWFLTLLYLLGRLYRGAISQRGKGTWQWAAWLALIGISLEMVVDNPLIEVDVMVPLAILIGAALAQIDDARRWRSELRGR
jgi:O-antigen ligase